MEMSMMLHILFWGEQIAEIKIWLDVSSKRSKTISLRIIQEVNQFTARIPLYAEYVREIAGGIAMKLAERAVVRRSRKDLVSLVKMPELVCLRPVVAGVAFDIEVEGFVADALADIARREGKSLDELCTDIHTRYTPGLPLASGVRAYTLNYYRAIAAA
jgi:hypothetical protein